MDYEPFSVRQATAERQGQSLIYRFDHLPRPFRNQVIRLIDEVIGSDRDTISIRRVLHDDSDNPDLVWKFLFDQISFEHGLDAEPISAGHARRRYIEYFLGEERPVSHLLDVIEISFRILVRLQPLIDRYQTYFASSRNAIDAVDELNRRFQRSALGYVFNGETLERVDSQYLHSETVDPALQLLNSVGFDGAEREFLSAHEHFRHGRNEEALVDALKSFESTMKHICSEKGWTFNANDTASALIGVVVQNGLIPTPMQTQLGAVRTILQSGLPTLRNRNAGHGQGDARRVVPDAVAAFGLHMAAANIVFLVECFKAS